LAALHVLTTNAGELDGVVGPLDPRVVEVVTVRESALLERHTPVVVADDEDARTTAQIREGLEEFFVLVHV
jgi:hypothetical protein